MALTELKMSTALLDEHCQDQSEIWIHVPNIEAKAHDGVLTLSPASNPIITTTTNKTAPISPVVTNAKLPVRTPKAVLPANQDGSTAVNHFNESRKIPLSKKLIFPNRERDISWDHMQRFNTVVDMLKRVVENDKKLRRYTQWINYSLKVCGLSAGIARPSVLVFCPAESFKALKKCLTKPHLKEQYDPKESATSNVTRLGICFWPQVMELLSGDMAEISFHAGMTIGNVITMCGARVIANSKENRRSTVGCIISVKSDYYALTTAHTFDKPEVTFNSVEEDTDNSVSDSSSDSASDSEYQDTDTDDDEDAIVANKQNRQTKETSRLSLLSDGKDIESNTRDVDFVSMECQVHIPPFDAAWTGSHPDLDWALLRLDERKYTLVNGYFSESEPNVPIFLSKSSVHPPLGHRYTDVLIISSRRFALRGILRSTPSYVGHAKGSMLRRVWTVTLFGNEALQKGDSGSLVIDAQSHEVYGQIFGVNPLGELYVVPINAILDQIKEVFGTSNVALSDLPAIAWKDTAHATTRDDWQQTLNDSLNLNFHLTNPSLSIDHNEVEHIADESAFDDSSFISNIDPPLPESRSIETNSEITPLGERKGRDIRNGLARMRTLFKRRDRKNLRADLMKTLADIPPIPEGLSTFDGLKLPAPSKNIIDGGWTSTPPVLGPETHELLPRLSSESTPQIGLIELESVNYFPRASYSRE